eukprot:689477_1
MATHYKKKASLELAMDSLNMFSANKTLSSDDCGSSPSLARSTLTYPQKVVRKLSIALRFLLHPNSPLNSNDMDYYEKYKEFNPNLHPKFDSQHINKIKERVNSLWVNDRKDIEQIQSVHTFWKKWYYEANQIQQTATSAFNAHEEENMKWDYLDFMVQHKTYSNVTNDPSQDELIPSKRVQLSTIQQEDFQDPLIKDKIDDLQQISNKKQMAQWLKRWKSTKLSKYGKCMKVFKTVRWKKDIYIYKLPMNEWTWQQVVSFIEYSESLKHFSSIFYSYQIDGQELCAMQFKTFECLIEYALMQNQNVFETDFEQFKRDAKANSQGDDWQLSTEIRTLLRYIHRGRIQSHVVSRYYLMYAILKHNCNSQFDQTARTVYDIITILTAHHSSAPKRFWKMDAYFYCKMDNFLAVLTADKEIRLIYRTWFPLLLDDDQESQQTPAHLRPSLANTANTASHRRLLQRLQIGWRTHQSTDGTVFAEDHDDDEVAQKNAHPVHKKQKMRYDCIDSVADKCCCNRKINRFFHSVPRVYFKVVILFLCLTLFGYAFSSAWYYNAATIATRNAVELVVESIAEREVNSVQYEFSHPQSLQQLLFGTMHITASVLGDANTSLDRYATDPSLDHVFVRWFSYPNMKRISSVGLYHNDTDIFIGGFKVGEQGAISVYDGVCIQQWLYDEKTKQRDLTQPYNEPDCDYNPRERPWYTALVDAGGVHNSVWTKPYLFASNHLGMTLSSTLEYDGSMYVLLTEFTVDSVANYYGDDRLLLPPQTVVMTVTPSLSVLTSTVGEIDLYDIECDECHATDVMITKTMSYLRNTVRQDALDTMVTESHAGYLTETLEDDTGGHFVVHVFGFDALYMDKLLFGKPHQHGYIVIMRYETQQASIEMVYTIAWILSITSLVLGFVFIIYNFKLHRVIESKRPKAVSKATHTEFDPHEDNGYTETDQLNGTETTDTEEVKRKRSSLQYEEIAPQSDIDSLHPLEEIKEEEIDDTKQNAPNRMLDTPTRMDTMVRSQSSFDEDADDSSIDDQPDLGTRTTRRCQVTQPVLVLILFCFMLVTFVALGLFWERTASSLIDTLIKDVMAPQEWNVVRDKVFHVIESAESIKEILANRLNMEGMKDIFEDDEVDQIFTNTMSSFVNKHSLPSQYFVYIGTPDGGFRGARVLAPDKQDLLISVRDVTNNFTLNTHYTDSWNMMRDTSQPLYDSSNIFDPRCRPWYIDAIQQRFSGRLEEAFPDNTWDAFSADDLGSLSRQTQTCKRAVEQYRAIFNNSNRTSSRSHEGYLVWTSYVFESSNSESVTASAIVFDGDSDRLLGVIGIDFLGSELSKSLNETVGIGTAEAEDGDWYSWVFNANADDPYVVGSSDYNVLKARAAGETDGCLQFEEESHHVPYSVYDHPNTLIKIISTEALLHYGVDADVWILNDSTPFELNAPIDYPLPQGGKISYYPHGSGLDWFVMKLVDTHSIDDMIEDARQSTTFVLFIVLMIAFIIFKEITAQNLKTYCFEEEEEDEEKNQNLSDLKIDINASSNGRKHTKTFSLMENDLKEESEEITEEMTLSLHGYVKEKFIADTLQGAVHVVRKHDSHARYVVKTGDKKLHSQGVTVQKTNGKKYRIEEDIVKEAAMMEKFMTAKHPSALIDFYEFFEDKDKYYLVMGHGGSDMFDFIVSCHDLIISNKLSIREWRRHIKFMFAQMVLFIAWMHKEQNCCNLDISLENLLISDTVNITENEDEFKLNQCYIKFIDFGLSEYFDATMNPCFLCTKFVGKQRYKAPEVYAKKGTFCANKADVWSMGICLFMMAVGAPPFDKPIDEDIAFKYVKLGKINDLLQSWNRLNYVTANLLDLLTNMLCADPQKRITIDGIMKHPWIKIYFQNKNGK